MEHAYTGDQMKIFTDTEKWDDKWFRGLSPATKLVYLYICDRSDHAGVWEFDEELLRLHTRIKNVNEKIWLHELSPKVIKLPNGKWWIKNYISFQNPRGISKKFKHCAPIFRSLEKNNVTLTSKDCEVEIIEEEKDSFDYKNIQEAWNRKVGNTKNLGGKLSRVPSVNKMTEPRKRAIRSAIKDGVDIYSLFTEVGNSNFLSGVVADFVATFDWVMKPQNIIKIMEGNYKNGTNEVIGCHTDEEYNRESF